MRDDTQYQYRAARAAAHAAVIFACAAPASAQRAAFTPPAAGLAGEVRSSVALDSAFGALDLRCPRARLSGACGAPVPAELYTGNDALGVPRYIGDVFTPEERRLLRTHFGVEQPERLYISAYGFLTYDTEHDRGTANVVPSHRVGAISARRPGETWEAFEPRGVVGLAARRDRGRAARLPHDRGVPARGLGGGGRGGRNPHREAVSARPSRMRSCPSMSLAVPRGTTMPPAGRGWHSAGYAPPAGSRGTRRRSAEGSGCLNPAAGRAKL